MFEKITERRYWIQMFIFFFFIDIQEDKDKNAN
jgi:hypothetical protein